MTFDIGFAGHADVSHNLAAFLVRSVPNLERASLRVRQERARSGTSYPKLGDL